jgi:hypothetical protein
MDNVIWAAAIQAAPIACAAVAGFVGLTTWRKQLREGRQVKHAEKALAAAGRMFAAIRAARSAHSQISESESADRTKQALALRRITEERLNHAWNAWWRFQERYALARLFADPAKQQLDVADEVADCIQTLQYHAKMMWLYDDDDRELRVKERAAFYGNLLQPEPDDIEERLRKAEKALRSELGPILLPTHRWGRFLGTFGRICNRRASRQ